MDWWGASASSSVAVVAAGLVAGICCLSRSKQDKYAGQLQVSNAGHSPTACRAAGQTSLDDGVHLLMNKPPCCLTSTVDEQPQATRTTKLERQRALGGRH
eukprot:COSAG02_NODE_3481_length_6671_cov_12.360012_7_plen_99_part_01